MACALFLVIVHVSFDFQPGMSIFLIWAYHYTRDVQPGLFAQHSFTGVQQVTLIPAVTLTPTTTPVTTPTTNPVTTPKPGGFNVFDKFAVDQANTKWV